MCHCRSGFVCSFHSNEDFLLMKQPISFILTIHFNNLIKCYSGKEVRLAMHVIKLFHEGSNFIWDDPLERHLGNLCNTYGQNTVVEFYDLIWGFSQAVA